MSYIVPMQKPVCQNCYFRVGRYCGIIESTEQVPVKKNRCPLVEIPTPHGRLIDADELANKTFYSATSAPYITYKIFVDTPTIIEAEDN